MADADFHENRAEEIVNVLKPPQLRSPVSIGAPDAEKIEEAAPMAGLYDIVKCDIISPNVALSEGDGQLEPVNMIPMIDTLTVYEDINKPYLLCDIAIRDSYGFRETIPIIGEEFVQFEAQTRGFELVDADNPLDNIIKKTFRVYTVSPIVNSTERLKLYVLHCISIEAIISEKKKMSKGYHDVKIESVVKDIYENYIAKPMSTYYSSYKFTTEPKKLIVEPTADKHTFCFPFKSPFDIMNDLAEKATSANEPIEDDDSQEEIAPADGALYMFYETLTQFKFESLETSFKREPKRNFVAKVDSSVDPKDTWAGGGWPGIAFNNVEEYSVDSLFDIIDNMREGMYAARLITHDMIRMRYEIIGYRYIEKKDDRVIELAAENSSTEVQIGDSTAEKSDKKLADFTISLGNGKLCSYNHDCLIDEDGGEGARVKLMGTNFNHAFFLKENRKDMGGGSSGGGGAEPGINETNLEYRSQKRDSQFQQLDNIKITLKLAGDSSLRVGDIIWWHMPSHAYLTESSGSGEDPFLSGKYIMTKINHVFTNERYYQEIQIRKDCLENVPPSLDEAVISAWAGGASAHEEAQLRLKSLEAAVRAENTGLSNEDRVDPTELKDAGDSVTQSYSPSSQSSRQAQPRPKLKPNKGRMGLSRHGTPTRIYDKQSLAESQGSSDIRLKENIQLIEEGKDGNPNIYSFSFKWDKDIKWRGVMAQELIGTRHSDAVSVDAEGFYKVDYSKLGFPMVKL